MKTLQFLEFCVCHHHHATHFGTLDNIIDFGAASLQMDLARSSGGVGWSFDDWVQLILTHAIDLAGLEHRRKPLDMISRICSTNFVFLKQHLAYRG